MPALGCLIPFVGAGIGGTIGGTSYAIWGGGAGFVIGLLGALAGLRLLERSGDSLPD